MSAQAVLFDLDGTLIDTAADFIATLNILCEQHGIKPPNDTAIRNTVSNGARALVTLAFNCQEGEPQFEALRQELLNIYECELGKNAKLFTQAQATLNALKQHNTAWGIVTNKPRLYTELLLKRMDLEVPVVVCPDDVNNTKPDPEPMLLACKLLGVEPSKTLYAGDHERDIQAGHNANMTTVACSWGYISPDIDITQWQANFIAHNGQDLLAIVNQFKAL